MKINFTNIMASALMLGSLIFSSSAMAQSPACTVNNQTSYYGYGQPVNYQTTYYQQKRTIGERIQNQKARINDGVRDHSLSGREADILRQRTANLERELFATSRNNYMTPAQYAHFQAELDQMSKVIYNARHNYENSYNRSGYYGNGNYNYRPVDRRYFR